MSKPTSIKTSEKVRDRLRALAEERGTTITELLEELAARELTADEREQRAREAARELGIEYTEQVELAGQDAWAKIRAHQGGAAA
jgi:sugar phosphate isomerase/epimerase